MLVTISPFIGEGFMGSRWDRRDTLEVFENLPWRRMWRGGSCVDPVESATHQHSTNLQSIGRASAWSKPEIPVRPRWKCGQAKSQEHKFQTGPIRCKRRAPCWRTRLSSVADGDFRESLSQCGGHLKINMAQRLFMHVYIAQGPRPQPWGGVVGTFSELSQQVGITPPHG